MGESTTNTDAATTAAHAFIARWSGSTASELASAQSFVIDLCELLGEDKPATSEADAQQAALVE